MAGIRSGDLRRAILGYGFDLRVESVYAEVFAINGRNADARRQFFAVRGGLLRAEHTTFDPAAVSSNSIFALFYLIIFGSLMGFTAYSWLLKNAQPAMVATYAYVNPVIAVILGWSIAGESLTAQMLIGAFIIVTSVVLITANKSEKSDDDDDVAVHHSHAPTCNRPSYSTSS